MVESCLSDLNHLELISLLGFGVQHVHGAAQSGIKGTNNPYNIEWILDISYRCSNESLFNWTWISFSCLYKNKFYCQFSGLKIEIKHVLKGCHSSRQPMRASGPVGGGRNLGFIFSVLDSRFHGNDRKSGPLKSFVSKS